MNLTDILNAPTELEFEGRVYKLRQPTLMEQAVFARWLEQRARDAAGRAVELTEDDRRQLLRDVNADIASGVYDWGGEACVRSLRSPSGLAKLLAVILADQGVTEATAAKILDRSMREIAAVVVSKVTDDPNSLRATLATLGLPADFLGSYSSPSRTRPSTTGSTTSPDSPPTSSSSSSGSSEAPTDTPG